MKNLSRQVWFKIALQQGLIPSVLYKYIKVETAKAILENGTLQFSRRSEFNDVYECKARINTDYSQADWEKYLTEQGVPGDDAAAKAKAIGSDPSEPSHTIKDAINAVLDRLGILCLAENEKNLLMWGHYTEDHKGVCLEFDITKDLDTFCFPKKVSYSNDYPEIDFFNNKKSTTEVIFHKSSEWAYEQEHRVVRLNAYDNKDSQPLRIPFNREALTGIYFGRRCSEENIAEIQDLARRNGYVNAKFYKMEQDETRYGLIACSI